MKKSVCFAVMASFASMLMSCTIVIGSNMGACNDNMLTDSVTVADFTAIEANACEVVYNSGNENKVAFSVCESISDNVVVNVVDGCLLVEVEDGRNGHKFKCEVTGRKPLSRVDVGGACHFVCNGDMDARNVDIDLHGASELSVAQTIKTETIDVDMSGASKMNDIEVDCKRLSVDASGASSVTVKGSCDEASYEASGASGISAKGVTAVDVDANASGASSISVTATGKVNRSSSGASTVSINR